MLPLPGSLPGLNLSYNKNHTCSVSTLHILPWILSCCCYGYSLPHTTARSLGLFVLLTPGNLLGGSRKHQVQRAHNSSDSKFTLSRRQVTPFHKEEPCSGAGRQQPACTRVPLWSPHCQASCNEPGAGCCVSQGAFLPLLCSRLSSLGCLSTH